MKTIDSVFMFFGDAAVLVSLAACSTPVVPVAQQPVVDARADQIESKIVQACLGSGLFKVADNLVLAPVPGGMAIDAVLDAGVDKVCADPGRFAKVAGTVEWVVRNLRDIVAAYTKA